jgi:NitT/TauT family transport system substrate-binding protein
MKKSDLFYTISLLLAIMGLLSSCASPQVQEKLAPLTIRIQQSSSLSYAPIFIALDEGFFKEQALTIDLEPFNSTSEGLSAIFQSNLDVMGEKMSLELFNAIDQNSMLKNVADKGCESKEHCACKAIVTRNNLIPQISGVADVKGRYVTLNNRVSAVPWMPAC